MCIAATVVMMHETAGVGEKTGVAGRVTHVTHAVQIAVARRSLLVKRRSPRGQGSFHTIVE